MAGKTKMERTIQIQYILFSNRENVSDFFILSSCAHPIPDSQVLIPKGETEGMQAKRFVLFKRLIRLTR